MRASFEIDDNIVGHAALGESIHCAGADIKAGDECSLVFPGLIRLNSPVAPPTKLMMSWPTLKFLKFALNRSVKTHRKENIQA